MYGLCRSYVVPAYRVAMAAIVSAFNDPVVVLMCVKLVTYTAVELEVVGRDWPAQTPEHQFM